MNNVTTIVALLLAITALRWIAKRFVPNPIPRRTAYVIGTTVLLVLIEYGKSTGR